MRKLTLLILVFASQVRPANNFALTIDNIMRGPGLVGFEPAGVRWSYDSSTIYFQWKQYTDKIIAPMDTYAVNRDGSAQRKLTDAETKLAPPLGGETSRDKRLTVYSSDGGLPERLLLRDRLPGQAVEGAAEAAADPRPIPPPSRRAPTARSISRRSSAS